MNATTDTTKVTNRNKFRNISIPKGVSGHRLWLLPQQTTVWSNVTNNTTKVTGRHKKDFFYNLVVGLNTGLKTSASISELLLLSNLAKYAFCL